MHEPDRRRFRLADVMIFVAMVALGITANRSFGWTLFEPVRTPQGIFRNLGAGLDRIQIACLPTLLTLTFAVTVMRLRDRASPARYIACEPGALACATVLFAISLRGCWIFLVLMLHPRFNQASSLYLHEKYLTDSLRQCGMYVLGAWFAMSLGAGWRRSTHWRERFARVLGVAWIAVMHIPM